MVAELVLLVFVIPLVVSRAAKVAKLVLLIILGVAPEAWCQSMETPDVETRGRLTCCSRSGHS